MYKRIDRPISASFYFFSSSHSSPKSTCLARDCRLTANRIQQLYGSMHYLETRSRNLSWPSIWRRQRDFIPRDNFCDSKRSRCLLAIFSIDEASRINIAERDCVRDKRQYTDHSIKLTSDDIVSYILIWISFVCTCVLLNIQGVS